MVSFCLTNPGLRFVHTIALRVININIDIGDKMIFPRSNFHLPFSRRDKKQPASTWLILPHCTVLLMPTCMGDGII